MVAPRSSSLVQYAKPTRFWEMSRMEAPCPASADVLARRPFWSSTPTLAPDSQKHSAWSAPRAKANSTARSQRARSSSPSNLAGLEDEGLEVEGLMGGGAALDPFAVLPGFMPNLP